MKQKAMSILNFLPEQGGVYGRGGGVALAALGLGILLACQPPSNGGLGAGDSDEFVPVQGTPSETASPSPSAEALDECAPRYTVTDASPALVFESIPAYAEGCQQFLKVEASYSMTCGALLGGHLFAELSFGAASVETPTVTETATPTEGETPSEVEEVEVEPDLELYVFLEATNPLLEYDFAAGTFSVLFPIEAINRTEWSMDLTLVDDLGYGSEAASVDVSLTDLTIVESDECASEE